MMPFPWSSLQNELKANVASFLPCREKARVSRCSKSISKACADAATKWPIIKNGCLSKVDCSYFCCILNQLRLKVFEYGLMENISPRARAVLAQTRRVEDLFSNDLVDDVIILNSTIFPFWDVLFNGAPGLFSILKDVGLHNKPEYISNHLHQVQHWPTSRLTGKVYVLMDRPDGTIVISQDLKAVYLVVSIVRPLGAHLADLRPLPCAALATFLPYYGYIAHDGLVVGATNAVSPMVRKLLYRVYTEAVDNHTLITSLPLKPVLTLPAAPTTGPVLSAEQQKYLARIKGLPKPTRGSCHVWVLKRHGLTEAENPEHTLDVVLPTAISVARGHTVALVPTVFELFDLLCVGLFGPAAQAAKVGKTVPWPGMVQVDDLSVLPAFKALLAPTGMEVGYHPPLSTEESHRADSFGGCASCHVTNEELVCWGMTERLKACTQCKRAQYCSRDCQKAHWKVHKRQCFLL